MTNPKLMATALSARISESAIDLAGIKDILDMLVDTKGEREIDDYAVLNLVIKDTTRIMGELHEIAEIAFRSEGDARLANPPEAEASHE